VLGSLRFFLACMVAFSHLRGVYLPLNLGGTSVIIFYFISGYLMSQSFRRFPTPLAFYKDRIARLYPAYCAMFLVGLPILYLMGRLAPGFSVEDIAANLLIVPLNYYLTYGYAVVRPAWSLASEIHFYLLVPLLYLIGGRALAFVAIGLTALHIGTFFANFSIDDTVIGGNGSTWLSYRLPIFTFAVFMMGFMAARGDDDSRNSVIACWLLYALFFFVLSQTGLSMGPQSLEIALGAIVAPPLVAMTSKMRAFQTFDRFVGGLAYPLFLTHIIAQQISEVAALHYGWARLQYVLVAWIFSLGSAYLLWRLVEVPMVKIRYRFRGFDKLQLTEMRPAAGIEEHPRLEEIEQRVPPFGHFVQDRVGDRRDRDKVG
jgi:peptidoglycan/LPS O-acetylase OafA/YrhL